MEIFDKFWAKTKLKIRSVRIALSNLNAQGDETQLSMWDNADEKQKKLNESLDKIRKKYGYYAVRRAKTLDKDYINYFEVDEEDNE